MWKKRVMMWRWSQTVRVMWKKRVMMIKLKSPTTKVAMTRILTQVEREDNLMILKRKKKTRPGKISMAELEPRTEPSFQINQRLKERILVVLVMGENTASCSQKSFGSQARPE